MPEKLRMLEQSLRSTLAERVVGLESALGELTLTVDASSILDTSCLLRDDPELKFEQLSDLCGIDYSQYCSRARSRPRYAVVYHLLSIAHNRRLRLRTYCKDDDFPQVASVSAIWPSANWYEREAFDLFGIVFPGHPDLRRILTDYGFVGHPLRKDFPLSGHVEMRYDPDQGRVIYQPVSIEPREIVPRVVREEHYGDVE